MTDMTESTYPSPRVQRSWIWSALRWLGGLAACSEGGLRERERGALPLLLISQFAFVSTVSAHY